MRTLALVDRDLFPASSGETIPNAAHVRALSELGNVDLACIGFQPKRPKAAPPHVRFLNIESSGKSSFAKRVWCNLRGKVPGIVPANPLELVAQLAGRKYDLVYVSQLRLMEWAQAARKCLPSAGMILSLCDSPTEIHRRMWKLATTSGFDPGFRLGCLVRAARVTHARRWERQAIELFDRVLVQSENDRVTAVDSAPHELSHRVVVARNGINEAAMSAEYHGQLNQRLFHMGPLSHERRQLVFWFVHRVFEPLRRRRPLATLHLVGSASDRDRRNLQRIPGVHCHGFVEDLKSMFQESTVSVAPMMMRFGFINKIAESMAAGLPVTGLGAFSGIPNFENRVHGVEVQSAEEWVSELDSLLDDPARLTAMSTAGRSLAVNYMRWQQTDELLRQEAQQLTPTASQVAKAA